MDSNLINYYWEGDIDATASLGYLTFNEAGTIFNKQEVNNDYLEIEIKADNALNEIGVAFFKTDSSHRLIRLKDNLLFADIVLNDYGTNHKIIDLNMLIDTYDENSLITLKLIIDANEIKVFVNDIEVTKIYENQPEYWKFGLYGEMGASISNLSVNSKILDSWLISKDNGVIVNRDNGLNIFIPETIENKSFQMSQSQTITLATNTSVSIDYYGQFDLEFYDNGILVDNYSFPFSPENIRAHYTTTVTDIDEVRLITLNNGKNKLINIQIEEGGPSSFTKDIRESGLMTIPSKKINEFEGSFAMKFKRLENLNSEVNILNAGDNFKIYINSSSLLVFKYGGNTISSTIGIQNDIEYLLDVRWRDAEGISLSFYDESFNRVDTITMSIPIKENISLNEIAYIGSNEIDGQRLATSKMLITNIKKDSLNYLRDFINDELKNTNNDFYIKFDYENCYYSDNIVVIPYVDTEKPIIIEDDLGNVYQRVSFIEDDKYSLYNNELFEAQDVNSFELSVENPIEVKVINRDTRQEYSDYLNVNGLVIINDYDNEAVEIRYTMPNCFCINYSEEQDQYLINLSTVEGKNINIYTTTKSDLEEKYIDSIELNPIRSSNNNGFVGITNKKLKARDLIISIGPESLYGDGFDESTITVEAKSENGLPTSNVDIEVRSLKGFGKIEKYITKEEEVFNEFKDEYGESAAIKRFGELITEEDRAGKYIYHYQSNIINQDKTDNILIKDNVSGINIIKNIEIKGVE